MLMRWMARGTRSLTSLRFFHTHRKEGCTVAAMDRAASYGRLSVVKFLHENRTEGCTTNAMDQAAESGQFPILKYLHKHRTEGCTTFAMKKVPECGFFHVLNWLHEFRDEGCTTAAMDDAVYYSHLTIIRFLHEHRTEGCTQRAFDSAIRTLSLDMVKFLHVNRKEGYHEAVLDEAVRRDPEDEHSIQQYLLPDELKDNRSRQAFLSKRKVQRLFRRGRFAPERRAEQAKDPYNSADEHDEWESRTTECYHSSGSKGIASVLVKSYMSFTRAARTNGWFDARKASPSQCDRMYSIRQPVAYSLWYGIMIYRMYHLIQCFVDSYRRGRNN